jgi:hypothetical protein
MPKLDSARASLGWIFSTAAEQFECVEMASLVEADDAEKMQRIEMGGVDREDLQIERLCSGKLAALKRRQSFLKPLLDRQTCLDCHRPLPIADC